MGLGRTGHVMYEIKKCHMSLSHVFPISIQISIFKKKWPCDRSLILLHVASTIGTENANVAMLNLKVLPGSHSSATWCNIAHVFMLCLPTSIHKEWRDGHHFTNNKESHTFQQQKPFFLQYTIDTNVLCTYLSSFSMNQLMILLYELINKKG